jgi:hypothetical protein
LTSFLACDILLVNAKNRRVCKLASTERGSWLRDLEKDLQKPVWEQQDECEARGFALAKVLTEVTVIRDRE